MAKKRRSNGTMKQQNSEHFGRPPNKKHMLTNDQVCVVELE